MTTPNFVIRDAQPKDVEAMHGLIIELAEYEKAVHEVESTASDLHAHLFGPNPSVFANVVEENGQVVGMAIWFLNYSTWQGKLGLYLEDLYVQQAHRGKGYGKALLEHLAGICVERGYGRFQWWVLDWNQPSIDFYLSKGAIAMDEWTTYRVTGEALQKLGSAGAKN